LKKQLFAEKIRPGENEIGKLMWVLLQPVFRSFGSIEIELLGKCTWIMFSFLETLIGDNWLDKLN
jgi:hypothetical protein